MSDTEEAIEEVASTSIATRDASVSAACAAAAREDVPVGALSAAEAQADTFTAVSESVICSLQKQIAALESQFKNLAKLSEGASHSHTPKMASQIQLPLHASLAPMPSASEMKTLLPPATAAIVTSSEVYTKPCKSQLEQNIYQGRSDVPFMISMPSVDQDQFNGAPPPLSFNSVQSAHLLSNTSPACQPYPMLPRRLQDLPEFSGKPEDWPMFHTAYIQTTAAYGYTNLENSFRLQKCLKGEARDTVGSLLIHPDNVGAVVNQLQFRFGRPEQLIRSQLNQVREIRPIPEGAIVRLIPFATKIKNLSVFLQSLNSQRHLTNPTLLEELISKLPMSERLDWARYSAGIKPYPTIVHFSDWLSEMASLICMVQGSESGSSPKGRLPVLHAAEGQRSSAPQCPICQGQHKTSECQLLLTAEVPERWSKVKNHRLCFACLRRGHSVRDCRNKVVCSVRGCQRRHHRLLHEEPAVVRLVSERTQSGEYAGTTNSTARSLLAVPRTAGPKLLFRVLPVTLYGKNKAIDTYALLDEGSAVTMMEAALIRELGLRGERSQLNVQWIGGKQAQEKAVMVDVHISGAGMKKRLLLRNVYGVSGLSLPTQSLDKREFSDVAGRCRGLSMQPYMNAEPKILIGLDNCHLGLPGGSGVMSGKGPYAANTELGWVIFGPTTTPHAGRTPSCLVVHVPPKDDSLHSLVAEHFEGESFGVRSAPPIESDADIRARGILESTTKRVGGRFQVALLWKDENIELPDSYPMAMKRLKGLEKKMIGNKKFADAYSSIVESYIEKKYARKLEPAEAAVAGPRTWYLPHFGVVNPNKPDRLRLVFDAAAEVDGTSLNTCLMKGSQQYQPLPVILFGFREEAVAVTGDIKEMFHQVLVQEEDRCAQRFLWRGGDSERPPDVYEMTVMTFGAACSPCAAHHVKTINALEHSSDHPRVVEAILNRHYVDDFVDSFESAEQPIDVSQRVREIHAGAGFELRNFASNSEEVLRSLEGSDSAVLMSAKGTLGTEKVLGLYWQPASDRFEFRLRFHHVDETVMTGARSPTKRELLSVVMSVFDPLGFLSHFTVSAKLMMREVWRSDVGWDEPLPDGVRDQWNRWRRELPDVLGFGVPRFYFRGGPPREIQLHVFVDASEDAFAAVAYWRVVSAGEEVETAFICSKTKCVPLKKPLTVPRLELQAAVLGARFMRTIVEEHSISVGQTVLWSDSTTVIRWIGSTHRRYKPFVAHRIAEILSTTEPSCWRWVPTGENPADDATRMGCRIEFGPSSRWLKGPKFLMKRKDEWPTSVTTVAAGDEGDEELRPKCSLLVVSKKFIEFNRFSSLSRLVRTMAWVRRFVARCRGEIPSGAGSGLTASEIDAAEKLLCRHVQLQVFAAELRQIGNGEAVSRDSTLYQLSPYVDSEGVLRVYGRIDAASILTYAAKRPIILPPAHEFTMLVMADRHCRMKHQNTEATICEIRRKYWIPRLRQTMRKVIANCGVCRINRASPAMPIMGPLPEDRVTPFVRPFTYTGLDLFGPLTVTIGRRTEKRWVALFTCLAVRAIHLEVVHDLSTDSCILAIRNFINRRGVPVRIRSDNGTNFVGANQEAKRFSEVFDSDRVRDELSSGGVIYRTISLVKALRNEVNQKR